MTEMTEMKRNEKRMQNIIDNMRRVELRQRCRQTYA